MSSFNVSSPRGGTRPITAYKGPKPKPMPAPRRFGGVTVNNYGNFNPAFRYGGDCCSGNSDLEKAMGITSLATGGISLLSSILSLFGGKKNTEAPAPQTPVEPEKSPLEAFEDMKAKMKDMTPDEMKTDDSPENGVSMVDDEWREMGHAAGDDPEKMKQVQEKYVELVKEFGAEYIQQLDKKYGDGDGKLSFEEFKKSEIFNMPEFANKDVLKRAVYEAAFDTLDLNKDNNLDNEEITSLLAAMDYDKEGNVNGRITINDYTRLSDELVTGSDQFVDRLNALHTKFFGNEESE